MVKSQPVISPYANTDVDMTFPPGYETDSESEND